MLGLSHNGGGGENGGRRAALRPRPTPLSARVTDADRAAHRAFVVTLGDEAIWKKYLPAE
jgi:DNA polymerase-3 subunit epsilon